MIIKSALPFLITLMTIFSALLLSPHISKAQFDQVSDSVEYKALVDLYNSTNGAAWKNNTNWLNGNTSTDFSTWFGITIQNGDIVRISLANNYLNGEIPASIGNLKRLNHISFSNNTLTGNIPQTIGSLPDLHTLYMSNNQLGGSIPEEIGELTKLQNLYLDKNNLSGTIPLSIGKLSSLQRLTLQSNRLTGEIPSGIPSISTLLSLGLADNELSGPIPQDLGKLKNLGTLYLWGNSLSGPIPESIGDCSNLHYLHIYDNQLSGNVPSSIGRLNKLRDLMLFKNNLSGTLPDSLVNLASLQEFRIFGNEFEGAVPEGLVNLENLRAIEVSFNKFTSFPDFTNHVNSKNMSVSVRYNNLSLKSIAQNFASPSNHVFLKFLYHNQSPPAADTLAFSIGETVVLETKDESPQNRYQWQKLNNGSWLAIPGQNSPTFTISSISEADVASYRCIVTNDWAADLTVYSKTFVLQTTAEFWSVGDGDWTADRIWATEKGGSPVKGYPKVGGKVFIVSNKITLNKNLSCGPVEVIVENSEASLTVDGAEVIVHGELKLIKKAEGYPGNIKVLNGGKIKPVNL